MYASAATNTDFLAYGALTARADPVWAAIGFQLPAACCGLSAPPVVCSKYPTLLNRELDCWNGAQCGPGFDASAVGEIAGVHASFSGELYHFDDEGALAAGDDNAFLADVQYGARFGVTLVVEDRGMWENLQNLLVEEGIGSWPRMKPPYSVVNVQGRPGPVEESVVSVEEWGEGCSLGVLWRWEKCPLLDSREGIHEEGGSFFRQAIM